MPRKLLLPLRGGLSFSSVRIAQYNSSDLLNAPSGIVRLIAESLSVMRHPEELAVAQATHSGSRPSSKRLVDAIESRKRFPSPVPPATPVSTPRPSPVCPPSVSYNNEFGRDGSAIK